MTPVHITKRALAVGGRDVLREPMSFNGCGSRFDQLDLLKQPFWLLPVTPASLRRHDKTDWRRVTCPACLVLLDAEFERGGGE